MKTPQRPRTDTMTRLLPTLATAGLIAAAALPGTLAGQDAGAIAIKAGKVITVTQGTLENVVILIENGVIKQISDDAEPSWNATVIDASDGVVMPTYVLAHTAGGMSSANENMKNVPFLTVEDAIDPSSTFFEEALRNGIGTLHLIPGNNTLIGGVGMIVRPAGRTVEDMTVRTKGGMKLSLQASGGSRMAQIRGLRNAFIDVQEYMKDYDRRKAEFEKEKAAGATDAEEFEEIDATKKPLVDLLAGKYVAYLYVPSPAEIGEALRIADGHNFEVVLVLGPACHRAAHRLARAGKPVILDGAVEIYETDPETKEETLECAAAELAKAGLPFALSVSAASRGRSSAGTASSYPWWQMATAVRHGVDRKTAIESMTIVPARILGLEDEFGSVEVGKVANLQILTGDPLQATTWVDKVLLEGEIAYERKKDPRLEYLFGEK